VSRPAGSGSALVLQLLRDAKHDAQRDGRQGERREERCSGEFLSERLGVSRAAIWKYVEALRKRGYEIEGTAGGGYCLTRVPDRLYPDEIEPRRAGHWLGHQVHHFDTIDSTNRVAFDLAREGAAHGTAVIAEQQTAGRGRLGRSFFSPAYQNLYTSIVLRPELTIVEAPTLILAAAVAVAEAVAASRPEAAGEVEIKWPNDVLLGGKKTSGILMEMSAEATRVGFAILGIGVNLNVDPADFPAEFRSRATSLRAWCGRSIDRLAFANRLYDTLEDALDAHAAGGFGVLRERFDALFRMTGRAVEVLEMNGTSLLGVAKGVADDGALLLERENGAIERVVAGDVTLSKEPSQEVSEATTQELPR
jgi:BirA family biotin operon repressor/biotin-[acetyl-CoA-carboxylase] ligase